MSEEIKISENILELIKEEIQTALIKRGFHAPLAIRQETQNGRLRIVIESAPFQTAPVIFRSLLIENFGGSVDQDKEHADRINVWMPVNVSWEHFDGGSNGTNLFYFTCVILKDNDDRIYKAVIK